MGLITHLGGHVYLLVAGRLGGLITIGYKAYSYDDYRRTMELFKRGLGLTEVCRILGLPKLRRAYYIIEDMRSISCL